MDLNNNNTTPPLPNSSGLLKNPEMAYTYGVTFGFNNQIVCHSKTPHLRNTRISEKTINVQPKILTPSQSTDHKTKKYIWVNPNTSESSNLKQKSHDSRYNSLIKLAEHLNSCSPVEKDIFNLLNRSLGGNVVAQDSIIILNNMLNPETARIVLNYSLDKCNSSWKLVLYNVTLNVFKKCKDLDSADQLFDEMLQRGITPDNVTFSTIIACARMCALPGKAVAWFERMLEFEIEPNDATFSVMIDAYGRVGNADMALMLYNRSRIENWSLGAVTFTTVIRIYGTVGDFDKCMAVFKEMKSCGIKPSLGCYNTLLDAITRGKRALDVKSIHQEIVGSGLRPGWATYAALLRAYCKALCGDEAMNVYNEMKAKGMVLNTVLYNTLLSTCADVGFVGEGIAVFEDMKKVKDCQPDTRTFSTLIAMFSRYGKVSEAEAALNEMLEAGFGHDIYVLTNLIQCYGKLNRGDDVARVLDMIMELELCLDERYCCCLLKVMRGIPLGELGKVARCICKADLKLGDVVRLVVGSGGEDEMFKSVASGVVVRVRGEVRKTYCNCLVDLCIRLDKLDKASYFRTLL